MSPQLMEVFDTESEKPSTVRRCWTPMEVCVSCRFTMKGVPDWPGSHEDAAKAPRCVHQSFAFAKRSHLHVQIKNTDQVSDVLHNPAS